MTLLEKLNAQQASLPQDLLFSVKKRAWERFLEMGLPERKNEFKYFPLHKLSAFESVASSERHVAMSSIVFIDGKLAPQLSDAKQVVLLPLEKALSSYGPILQRRFELALKEETNPFAMLNQALFNGGAFLYIPPQTKLAVPLKIVHYATNAMPCMRLHLFLGKGAQAQCEFKTVVSGKPCWDNRVIDAHLEEGARLQLLQNEAYREGDVSFHALRSSLKRDSVLEYFDAAFGNHLSRQDLKISLLEENAEAKLKGIWLFEGAGEVHSNIDVRHHAPHTRSLQHFKGALKERSKSSFEGRIYVAEPALKTQAYQLNNNLLLDSETSAYSKPNLKIHADDVKASHGSTTADLSKEELFYLRARGLSEETARNYLLKGFLKEILDAIPDEQFKNEVMQKL